MAFIYKIINDINDKVYIGKTEFSIEKRFQEHCADAFRDRNEQRPLYAAMRKYGIEHFHVEQLEETDNPIEREIYWIGFYDGYKSGYNATLGGDGKLIYNHQEILTELQINPYPKEISEKFGCCVDIVYDIAKYNGIVCKNRGNENFSNNKKKISAFIKDNIFIKDFDSVQAASEWCFAEKKCSTLSSGVRGHIADAANGKRKSAYSYLWRYG